MNLFETLKQLKQLTPDEAYTAKSKRAILSMPQQAMGSNRFILWRILETGAAVVLGGFFILLITGGLSGSSPVQYSVIDTKGLDAEAQAIDIQIQLANLEYPQSTSTAASPRVHPVNVAAPHPSALASTTSTAETSSNANAGATSSLSIDDALQALSQ